MLNQFKYVFIILICVIFITSSCNKKAETLEGKDGIVSGKTSITVDESLLPIIEDELAVFQNTYNATITLIPKSENEGITDLLEGKSKIIVLSRKLDSKEMVYFNNKKLIPKVTPFAKDAIALIKSKKSNDTLVVIQDIIDFMKGKQNRIKGLVFDNPNSSAVRYFKELAGLNDIPEKGVYSFKTNDEVIKYVANNDGMIGIVGINWIAQPLQPMQKTVDQVAVLYVKKANNQYVYPSQDNIAAGKYPLARDLYIINCQGYDGLGIGFSSFVAGQIGQRIILKSGLVPFKMPGRNIRIRN